MNPQPKQKPLILKGKAYHEFRKKVAEYAYYKCEYCEQYAPFNSKTLMNGEVSHIRKRKFGGDVMSNVKWSCNSCHRKKHNGERVR